MIGHLYGVPMMQQPQFAASINKGNPLARGLVFAAFQLGTGMYDAVSRQRSTGASTFAARRSVDGNLGLSGEVHTTQVSWPVYSTGLDSLTGAFSIFAEGTMLTNSSEAAVIRSVEPNDTGNGVGINFDDTNLTSNGFHLWANNGRRFSSANGALGTNSEQSRHRVLITCNGTTGFTYCKGAQSSTAAEANTPLAEVRRQTFCLYNGSGGAIALTLAWNRVLSPAEYAQLNFNPWQLFLLPVSIMPIKPPGGGAAAGTGAPSIPSVTAAGTGVAARVGSGAPTVPFPTAAGDGRDTYARGTGAPSTPSTTAAGTGVAAHVGTGAPSTAIPTAAGTGLVTKAGTGAPSIPSVTGAGVGIAARVGSGSPSIPSVTGAGTGVAARVGTGAPSTPSTTAAGTGIASHVGAGAPTAPSTTGDGAGRDTYARGAGAPSTPATTAAGTGVAAHVGTGAPSIPSVTGAGTGVAAHQATGAPVIPRPTAAGSGAATAGPNGTGSPTIPSATAAGTGIAAHTATGAPSTPAVTAAGDGRDTYARGTGAPSTPSTTAAGTGVAAHVGTGAPSAPIPTAAGTGAGSGAGSPSGSGTTTVPHTTMAGVGVCAHQGTGAPSIPSVTGTGSGTQISVFLLLLEAIAVLQIDVRALKAKRNTIDQDPFAESMKSLRSLVLDLEKKVRRITR